MFAAAKDAVQSETLPVFLTEDATVADLRAAMLEMVPQLSSLPRLLIAVNKTFAVDSDVLKSDDEVACFPPVSGG